MRPQGNLVGEGTLRFAPTLIDILAHLPVGTECEGPECRAFITLLDGHHRLLHREDASREEITESRTNLRLCAAAMDIIHDLDNRESIDNNFAVDLLDGILVNTNFDDILDRLVDEWAIDEGESDA